MKKAKGKHPFNALNAMRVKKISSPGRYADGNCLYLVVDQSGAKRWVLRIMVHGRRRDMGLGGIKTVTLAEARAKAYRYRKVAREGGNPFGIRHMQKNARMRFGGVMARGINRLDPIEDRKTRQNECKEEVYVSFVRSGERSGDKRVLTVHQGNALVIETELTQGTIHKLLRELVKIM